MNWLVDFVSRLVSWLIELNQVNQTNSQSLSLLSSQVPDGATVALIPRSQSSLGVNQFYQTGESKFNTFWSIKSKWPSLLHSIQFIWIDVWSCCRNSHAGGRGGGRSSSVASGEAERGPRDPQTQEEQHEREGAGKSHSWDLPYTTAFYEGTWDVCDGVIFNRIHATSNKSCRFSYLFEMPLTVSVIETCSVFTNVYLQGTLQKFVDDVFVAILSRKRPPPIAVRFFFDFLDDMAEKHGIDDPETVHIWKTNRSVLFPTL